LIDTTPEEYVFGEVIVPPGGFFVVQNPRGAQNDNGRIELRNNLDELVDAVTYGNWDDGSGQPSGIPDGNASGLPDESLSRIPDGNGTNWVKTFASRGMLNISPNSRPVLSISRPSTNRLEIKATAVPGKRFTLQTLEHLTDSWTNIYTNGAPGEAWSTEVGATNKAGFYRAKEYN
jgi:hypothetical protein